MFMRDYEVSGVEDVLALRQSQPPPQKEILSSRGQLLPGMHPCALFLAGKASGFPFRGATKSFCRWLSHWGLRIQKGEPQTEASTCGHGVCINQNAWDA